MHKPLYGQSIAYAIFLKSYERLLTSIRDQRSQRENNDYEKRLAQFEKEKGSADPTYRPKKAGRDDDSDDDIDNKPLFANRKRKRPATNTRRMRKTDFQLGWQKKRIIESYNKLQTSSKYFRPQLSARDYERLISRKSVTSKFEIRVRFQDIDLGAAHHISYLSRQFGT